MTTSASPTIIERIMEEGGGADESAAEQALRATLIVLGQRLTDDESRALRTDLPEKLAAVVAQSEYDGDFDAAELYERVRRRQPELSAGMARERTEVVLRVLTGVLSDEVVQRLVRALPADLGRHLLPIEVGEPPPHARPAREPQSAHVTTLAHGRPGSTRPLSEARALPGHTHSVAENADPHADTKLSSSRGFTQERHRESLASGRPRRGR